ncbi:MAG: hypothetical protein QM756_33490 [Polyangiaceae bacterium]
MMRPVLPYLSLLSAVACARPCQQNFSSASPARAMVVVDERAVMRDEPAPHGEHGRSTAYRISDGAPTRTFEFRKRVLHVGSAIGEHPLTHDEVYYVLAGQGEVHSSSATHTLQAGFAAYLYAGATVSIRQLGTEPLTLIIAYPLPARTR